MATFNGTNLQYLDTSGNQNGGFNYSGVNSGMSPMPTMPKMQPVPTYQNTPTGQSSFTNTSSVAGPQMNIDAGGRLYNQTGQPQTGQNGQPIQYGNVSGNYAPPASPNGYSGTNIFSNDPSTAPYEQLLNSIVGKLNTPYTPPDYQSTLDSLKSYIGRLNGPAYTPDQMALFQTQAFDPIMAQRDSDNKAIINRFAAQGMGPSSGPVQAAILANNQKYGQMGTTARANVATGAVNQQNQNFANAATLQSQLPTIETGLNTYNNQNAQQAATLAGIIPTLAWNRLQGTNNGMSSSNPASLLQLLNSFNQTNNQQGAAYSSALQGILPYLFPMLGL